MHEPRDGTAFSLIVSPCLSRSVKAAPGRRSGSSETRASCRSSGPARPIGGTFAASRRKLPERASQGAATATRYEPPPCTSKERPATPEASVRWQPSEVNFERSSRKTAITESTRPFTVRRTASRAFSAGLSEYQTGAHASPQSSGSSPQVAPSVVPVSFAGSEMRVALSVSSFAGVTSSASRVVARPCSGSPP